VLKSSGPAGIGLAHCPTATTIPSASYMGRIRWRRGNNALLLMNEIIAAAFGLMGAIVGSIITLAGQCRHEKTNKNRELSYAAIVISYATKMLACRTWDANNNFDEYQQLYNEEHRHFPCDTPMLDLNSFDINWKAVPISCLDKIFECSNRLEIKAKYLNTTMASNMDVVECDAYMLLEQIEIIDTLFPLL
jgi:hypothetical protein